MERMNSFTSLKTSVATWLDRDDLTSYIPDFITMAESQVYRDLRIRCMETSLSESIASGVVAVPTGYKEMKFAYIAGTPVQKLTRKDAEWIYYNYPTRSTDAKPMFFAREGDNFIFGPYATNTETMKGIYYKKLDALSTSNETNWFTDNAPEIFLYAALTAAEPFLGNDPRLATWKTLYIGVKNELQREDKKEELSGSRLQVTAA